MIHSPASKVKSEILFHDTFSWLSILPSGLQGRRGFVINYIFSSAKSSQKNMIADKLTFCKRKLTAVCSH
ncbi:hypothetical protein HMPREF1602_00724, partial [Escherichia coli 907889]